MLGYPYSNHVNNRILDYRALVINCSYEIWPAAKTYANAPAINDTGFSLPQDESYIYQVPIGWSGRLWARTECSTNSAASCDCGTGEVECNVTRPFIENVMTFVDIPDNKTYEINRVNGFSIPVSVTPTGHQCTSITCQADLNTLCPPELTIKDQRGAVIACKSTCVATEDAKYCCTGAFESPDTCQRTDYRNVTEQVCPQAYSFAADKRSSLFYCNGAAGYVITFCP